MSRNRSHYGCRLDRPEKPTTLLTVGLCNLKNALHGIFPALEVLRRFVIIRVPQTP